MLHARRALKGAQTARADDGLEPMDAAGNGSRYKSDEATERRSNRVRLG
jgi:hypothetical protein